MIDKELLEILACPKCKAEVQLEGDWIVCQSQSCGLRYPIRDGIPVMLIEEAEKICPSMSDPTLSIIIPAWNEEKTVGRAIESLQRATAVYERERGATAEIIVVDNNSSDRTGDVAREHGARVVFEPVNNIGKARNAGAKAARGRYIAFCDADNQVTENLLVLIHDHLEDPKIAGGGTWIEPSRRNLKINFFYFCWGVYVRCSRVGVGMMHCRKVDFDSFGGFDETIYAAEDVQLAYDLKKLGCPRGQKFHLIHTGWIITSTRKIDQTPLWEMLWKLIGFGFGLQKKIRSKKYCEHWYDKAAR